MLLTTIACLGFFGTMVCGIMSVEEYDDTLNAKLNWKFLLSMMIGGLCGAYLCVGFSWWLVVMFPLAMPCWLMITMAIYFLAEIMGVIK